MFLVTIILFALIACGWLMFRTPTHKDHLR